MAKRIYIVPVTEVVKLNSTRLMGMAGASDKGSYGGAPPRQDRVF